MEKIKGITFAPFCRRGMLALPETKESFDYMIEATHADFVIFAPSAIQETAHSEEISWKTEYTVTDEELIDMLKYAKSKGIRTALKPTLNCKDGTWRAFVSFFEEDVPCEPKWSNWFKSYRDFQVHYAKIAEQENCEMFIAGCEMVMTEHREQEWREVISAIREEYHGPVSYNTDKYQEHRVKWWDCVDVISSSGYYPIDKWEQELDRIEAVVKKYNKPFFFAEAGCMSRKGSAYVPNNWSIKGELCLQEQVDWYQAMFSACEKREWVGGFGLWEWSYRQMDREEALLDERYELCRKPVQDVVAKFYEKNYC